MISEKYNLDIGINTNCIEIEKLIYMIKHKWINRVIVGLDYFDKDISKNSPVGVSSKQILDNILKIKSFGCDVSISSVYNDDLENKIKMLEWGIEHEVRIKILEIVNQKRKKYIKRILKNGKNITR